MLARLPRWALALAASTPSWPAAAVGAATASPHRPALAFPRDFGAHPEARIEWWYLTAVLADAGSAGADGFAQALLAPRYGVQLTFFRLRAAGDSHATNPSAFAPRQWLVAHAAVSELARRRLLHASRAARALFEGSGLAEAARGDTSVRLRDWQLLRQPQATGADVYQARATAPEFAFDLRATTTAAPLLQGQAGMSLKAPPPPTGSSAPLHASRYYSRPQMQVQGSLRLEQGTHRLVGLGWLDHEWSDALLHPQAQGWDWAGIHLLDGGALTLFQLRRRSGPGALWAGGSWRGADGRQQNFGADDLRFTPLAARWRSPVTQADYPLAWRIDSPIGAFTLQALFDAQEVDSRASVGSAYWEGLAELRAAGGGPRLGLGYLEMTGYAGRLRL